MKPLSKSYALQKLIEIGMPITTIVDVGVREMTRELRDAFPDKRHLLFEPISEWSETIHVNYSGVEHQLLSLAASDTDGEAIMITSSVEAGRPITHARFDDDVLQQRHGVPRQVNTVRLDTILPKLSGGAPYLLKIDTDGAELKVLAGAAGILDQCAVVIIECSAKAFAERMQMVVRAGFTLFDIVDHCYYDGRFVQCDLFFINTQMASDLKLHTYDKVQKFDVSKFRQVT